MKRKLTSFSSLLSRHLHVCSQHLGGVLSSLRNSSSSLDEYLNEFTVTESSSDKGSPTDVFNPDNTNYWYTGREESTQWIQIEMKTKYITMVGYILTTFDNCCGYPRTWYLEGRNSASESWQRIDTRQDDSEMNKQKYTKQFTNNVLSSCTFKIFRLTQTDNWYSSNYLGLNEMDFIGVIREKMPSRNCETKICSFKNVYSRLKMAFE